MSQEKGLAGGSLGTLESAVMGVAGSAPAFSVAVTTAQNFLAHPALATEAFGPFTLVVTAETAAELTACARALEGQLTATLHGNADDLASAAPLVALLEAAGASAAEPLGEPGGFAEGHPA
jgi:acyl-CoA reductase-like NAD-dependent aldehyde dehydrogenase